MSIPRGVKRTSPTDNYPTPTWATHALLDLLDFKGTVLEPASGTGSMVKALRERGLAVDASDIREGPEIEGTGGVDFLRAGLSDSHDNVITNPPFRTAENFLLSGLQAARSMVALLLRLQFLETKKRYKLLTLVPPRWVLPFSSRLSMYPEGTFVPEEDQVGGTAAYAWFVWQQGYTGLPGIRLIPPRGEPGEKVTRLQDFKSVLALRIRLAIHAARNDDIRTVLRELRNIQIEEGLEE